MGITYDTTQTGNIFSIDYSKRGAAKCKRCSKLITKDALRIRKLVQFKSKHIKQFLHIHCAIESFRKARVETSISKDPKDLDGLDQLNTEDKSYITKLFEDKIAIINLPPPKEKITILAPLKVRRSQLKSVTIPNFNVMFTNADQLTSSKMSELITRIQREKPLIIAVCEIKPNNSKDRSMQDSNIPGFAVHPINLDTQIGRGMAVYTHISLEKSVIEIKHDVGFEEVFLLEVRLLGGDVMLFGSFNRSPTIRR